MSALLEFGGSFLYGPYGTIVPRGGKFDNTSGHGVTISRGGDAGAETPAEEPRMNADKREQGWIHSTVFIRVPLRFPYLVFRSVNGYRATDPENWLRPSSES